MIRCNQETAHGSHDETTEICGAPAVVMLEDGPRCQFCFETYGGAFVSSLYVTHTLSPLRQIALVEAAAELERRRPVKDLGTLMGAVIDHLTNGGAK